MGGDPWACRGWDGVGGCRASRPGTMPGRRPTMLTRSFIFAKGMTEDLERALWGRGLVTWELLRKHPGEAGEVMGQGRAMKLGEAVGAAEQALARCDHAWFKANWPDKEV